MHRFFRFFTAAGSLLIFASSALRATVDLTTATIADLQAAYADGSLTAEKVTAAYLARVAAYDQKGPTINAVILLNPDALATAKALDAERAAGHVRGPLHGIPMLLKDNIDVLGLPTTAGSQMLAGSLPPDTSFVAQKLLDAGAILIAKTNLSEWAGGGGSTSGAPPEIAEKGRVPNGFSSQGGQTRNPHVLNRGPAGSSGGTGAGIAAIFGQFGLGTDTAASVRGPANAGGVFGLKTTHGLVSRDGVVPLALSFDTVGPLARSTYDIAAALTVMAGIDPDDDSTLKGAGRASTDYTTYLKSGSLRGARIGIARDFFGQDAQIDAVVEAAIKKLQALGAIIVDDIQIPSTVQALRQPLYNTVRSAEFIAQVGDYLATTAPQYPKNIHDLARISHDPASGYRSPEKAVGLKYQAEFALSVNDPVYLAARDEGMAFIQEAMEGVFANHQLHALLYPTSPTPVSLIAPDPATRSSGGGGPLNIANITGFPDLVVPCGMSERGLPVTFSLMGRAFTEGRLLAYGYDYEQATKPITLPVNTPKLPTDNL
jgi:amidase